MTALKQYIRLESIGNWQTSPDAELREVIVSFGNSTLMLRMGNDAALTHWALSATHVISSDETGTTYSPDPEARETLHILDRDMIDAIAQVTAARTRHGPVRRRNRLILLLAVLAFAGTIAALGPDLLKAYTAHSMSLLSKQSVAGDLLGEIEDARGAACSLSGSKAIYARLIMRSLPAESLTITVVPLAGAAAAVLPGGRILLDPKTISHAAGPEELAGWIIQEALQAQRAPPMLAMLRAGSLRATFDLLSSGRIDPALVRQTALNVGLPDENAYAGLDAGLLEALAAAGLPSLPFATAIARENGSIDRVRRLRAGNTIAAGTAFEPALTDQDWVQLKGMCGG